MIARAFLALLLVLPLAGQAAGLMPTRTIPSRAVVGPGDLAVATVAAADLGLSPDDAVGMEARVTLYPGRPLRPGDLTPAAAIERNQIVTLRYRRGTLAIETEGRALDRAPPGARVRVMNLSSRAVVIGTVTATGLVEVGR